MRRSGSRTPKNGAHSDPAYVVGTETSGSPDAADAALAVSTALPPPTARMPSTPAGTSMRCEGISFQRAAAESPSRSQRREATRNGAAMPSSPSSPGSSPSPQTTLTSQPVPGEADERVGDARRTAAGGADERDLTRRLEPFDPRLGDRPLGEVRLDGCPRDEAHAESGAYRHAHRLLDPELEPDVEVAQPHARAAQLVLDHLPHAGALLHEDQRLTLELREADCAPCER